MKGYSPSTELLNLYDTAREKPFEFMHSRSFVNINVATGWTVSRGGQFPYENVITLPIDEGDFPITMEYQPTAIIQPNANESCAPSNFPYVETTGRNKVTLYAYSIPSSTSMLPIVINLTQNGSPHGSTNASAQRSTVEQTMIQLSQNYFLVEVSDEVLTKDTTITFNVTAYKGGERVPITPPADQPEYAITNQDGDPIQNPSGGTYPSVTVAAAGDESVKVTINLLKGTSIKNGVAIIQFPVQAGTVFYPRATINAITSTAILEQVESYDLSFGTLTRSSSGDFFVNDVPLGVNNKWIIKATKRTLNGVISSLSSGTVRFTDVEKGTSYSKSLSNSEVILEEELRVEPAFKGKIVRIDLEIGNKVVESKLINIIVSVFSTLIQPSVEYIVSGSTNNIRFASFTLLEGGAIVPKYGTLTIYKNSVNEANKLLSKDNVNEINYSLIPAESLDPLEGVGNFIATFTETIGGTVSQQRVVPVVGGIGELDIFSLVASPVVLMVDVDKDYELKSTPVSTLKVYRNGSDVSEGFSFAAASDGGTDFNFNLDGNQLTVTKFAAGASQIVGVIITATNDNNPNIIAIGSLQAIRQMEDEIISYYTYIRYTSNVEDDTPITEDIVDGTKYMGLVVTTSATAPSDKAEYNWTPVGEDGRGIKSTNIDYAVSDNGTEQPELESDLWGDFPDSLEKGSYLWTRTKITYTDGEVTYGYSVSYIAVDGPKGDTGDRGPAGPVLRIEAPDGLAFSKNQTKSIRLEAKLMDEDINRIGDYAVEGIRWERSSSDSVGDILFASTKQGPSIYIDPEFLNVPATYTCFISKIVEDDLTIDGEALTNHQSEVISVNTYSPVIFTAHVTTSLEISEEIEKIEKTIENIKRDSVTASEFKREQNRIFGSVSEVITTTADLVTRVDGMKDEVQKQVLKQEALTSELDMTSTRIRGEVKAVSDKGDRQYSSLQIKSDSIETEVGKMSDDMSEMSSRITQTADEISSKVSANGVVSAINQTSEIIKIDASKINLTGYVTVSSLSGQDTTTIDGSNIKTGTISAERLNLTDYVTVSSLSGEGTTTIDGSNIKTGTINAERLNLSDYVTVSSLSGQGTTTIDGSNIKTGTINANRLNLTGYATTSYADNKANTAQSNAKTYTDGQKTAIESTLKNYTDDEISAFSGGLGDLAFKDKIGTALLDSTIISGGYIRTNLISFNNAVGTNVNLTGTITATDGKIGGWDITRTHIDSRNGDARFFLASHADSSAHYAYASNSAGNRMFSISKDGELYARNASISGQITATSGNIAGWAIGNGFLDHESTGRRLRLSTIDTYSIFAGTDGNNWNFILNKDGTVQAKNAEISGKITATSGVIGGFTINNTTMRGADSGSFLRISGASGLHPILVGPSSSDIRFQVQTDGSMIAKNADISGKITATSGTIGGLGITSAFIEYRPNSSNNVNRTYFSGNPNDTYVFASYNSSGTRTFSIARTGGLYATGANISGTITATSGKIGNWNIGSYLSSDGAWNSANHIFLDPRDTANFRIYVTNSSGNRAFSVDTSGGLTATSATITGTVNATGGYFTGGGTGQFSAGYHNNGSFSYGSFGGTGNLSSGYLAGSNFYQNSAGVLVFSSRLSAPHINAGVTGGNGHFNNLSYEGTFSKTSDIRKKENFKDIHDEFNNFIYSLPIGTYNYKGNKQQQIGINANFVDKMLPKEYTQYLINKDEVTGYYSANYIELVPMLVKVAQSQNTRLIELEYEIAQLKKEMIK